MEASIVILAKISSKVPVLHFEWISYVRIYNNLYFSAKTDVATMWNIHVTTSKCLFFIVP